MEIKLLFLVISVQLLSFTSGVPSQLDDSSTKSKRSLGFGHWSQPLETGWKEPLHGSSSGWKPIIPKWKPLFSKHGLLKRLFHSSHVEETPIEYHEPILNDYNVHSEIPLLADSHSLYHGDLHSGGYAHGDLHSGGYAHGDLHSGGYANGDLYSGGYAHGDLYSGGNAHGYSDFGHGW